MTGFDDTDLGDDGTLQAALAWLVRIQSDAATAPDWSELTVWLETSPAHAAVFESVERLSAAIDGHSRAILAGIDRPTAEIVPFPRRPPAAKRRWQDRRAAIAAAVAGLSVLTGLGAWRASEGQEQVYRTAIGETRAVTLADGSHIRLDAASTLKVRLGWFARKVDMGDAEATFDIAKSPGRPFEVAVGDQKVRDIGTEFNIRAYDGAVNVTVRRGVVAVYQPNLGDQPVARLTQGWAMRHTVGSSLSYSAQVDPDSAFAWTQGRLICDGRPLSEIVAYLNRRYERPIHVSADVAARRFTGVLELDDQADVARRLAAYLSLGVHGSERDIVLS